MHRIVSLLPAATEIAAWLGLMVRLLTCRMSAIFLKNAATTGNLMAHPMMLV
jgi:hypothetical protein